MKYFKLFEDHQPLTMCFVGDIMQHQNQIDRERERGWSYSDVFNQVEPIIREANVSVGNLETLFAGLPVVRSKPDESPQFSAPDPLAKKLHQIGFDLLSLVNNHMYDHEIGGHQRTIEILRSVGIIPIDKTRLTGARGKLLCFHPHSTYMNPDEAGHRPSSTRVSLEMKPHRGAFNIALMHWGGQFTGVNDEMREQCQYLVNEGFDMVIGSGPHIELPVEMIGDTLVAWSLGNFLSSHERHNADKPNRGIILEVQLGKEMKWNTTNIQTINNKIEIT